MPSCRSKEFYCWRGSRLPCLPQNCWPNPLLYEREFTMIGMQDNTLRMELTESGELTIERPASMTHSGRHELAVQSSIYSELGDQLAARYADSRQSQFRISSSGPTRYAICQRPGDQPILSPGSTGSEA